MIQAICALPLLWLAARAEAAPAQPQGELDEGAYLQLSPGVVTLLIDEHRFTRRRGWGWPWSIGAGRMFTRGPWFKATIGAAFEHRVMVFGDTVVHGLGAMAESRLGAGNRRISGYVLVGIGAAGTYVPNDYYGLTGQFGLGVQSLVGRRFFVGGELDFDISYHPRLGLDVTWNSFYYHLFTAELILGLYF